LAAHDIAAQLAETTGLPIIDNTERGKFLSNPEVELAIRSKAAELFMQKGLSKRASDITAKNLLYGDPNAPAR
jgi:hypothetical protein